MVTFFSVLTITEAGWEPGRWIFQAGHNYLAMLALS